MHPFLLTDNGHRNYKKEETYLHEHEIIPSSPG